QAVDDPKIIVAVIAAFSSLVVAIISAVIARKNQRDFEVLRAELDEEKKEKDALRDYWYEARKRLYHECEPLLFLLAEVSETARGRIYGLARRAQDGKLSPTPDEALLRAHSAEALSAVTDLAPEPELGCERFDWRKHPGEATDEEVLVHPFAVSRAYLENHRVRLSRANSTS